MRLHFKQILKNDIIWWKFVSVSAPPFYNHYTSYYSSSSVWKRLIHFTRRLFDSEQLSVLAENGRIRSMDPDETPMAMLQDIKGVFQELKTLVSVQEEQIQRNQAVGGPSKRQRTI